jgi:flagellar hook-associated protein 2
MASGISISGLGGGIDFGQITDAIVSERMRPVAQLQRKSADYSNRSASLKQLNGLLINLKKAAADLTKRELGTGRQATSSDSSVLSLSADATAVNGKFNLQVSRLATNLVQASRSYSAASATILPDGQTTATFELRKAGEGAGTEIVIDSSNNSLAGLRDAINAADADVTAAIVDVSGNNSFQLVLTSKETGAEGRVELVETSSTGTLVDLNLRRLDGAPDPLDFSGLDAELSINGLEITRSSNSIADAVAGLTLELKKAGSATVTVATNSAEVTGKLQAFINAYNAVQDFVLTQYKVDGEGRPSGALAGDATLRSVQQQLRHAVGAISSANGGALESLADIGIGREDTGKLTLDQKMLSEKLTDSLADVRSLLFGETESQKGIANNLDQLLGDLSDDINGTVQTAINGYKTSIDSIGKSVANQLASINSLRASLSRQFAVMDAAMGQLNSQSTALTTILKSMQPKDDQ